MIARRLSILRNELKARQLDCILITSYENYRYFSGFTGSNCALVITRDSCFALTDSRYDVQIRAQATLFTPIVIKRTMNDHISELLQENGVKTVGYETSYMSDLSARDLKRRYDTAEWVPLPFFGDDIRAIKDEGEISLIRRASKIADDALSSLATKLSRDMTERGCAAYLEYMMALGGSERPAFETIAASGLHGAMPHAEPTDDPLPTNGLLTLDFGACVGGYMSDITRTLHLGTPSDDLCRIWDIVFDVQRKCIEKASAGITCRELDEYQRDLFAEYNMDKYIMHSLGHGVGLAIHEAPTVSKRSDATLSNNMVITIEPGLYIEGLGGVRIEDTVLITESGAETLTHAPYRYDITMR